MINVKGQPMKPSESRTSPTWQYCTTCGAAYGEGCKDRYGRKLPFDGIFHRARIFEAERRVTRVA